MTIAPATTDDLPEIADIYHHYVLSSAHTFDLEPKPATWWREWYSQFEERGRHRLFVAHEDAELRGYALSEPYRPRPAYDPCVTTSVYVSDDHTGRGIGSALYRHLISAIAGEDVHRACAAIAMPNPASVRLHERHGFRQVGYFSEQGRKFGRYWDVAWFELSVQERSLELTES